MKRKFRLRNGGILIEKNKINTVEENSFIDDYEVLDSAGMPDDVLIGQWICLSLKNKDAEFPTGGAWGSGFDIMSEIIEDV